MGSNKTAFLFFFKTFGPPEQPCGRHGAPTLKPHQPGTALKKPPRASFEGSAKKARAKTEG